MSILCKGSASGHYYSTTVWIVIDLLIYIFRPTVISNPGKQASSDVLDMPVDPNEPTYCLCHQVSFGEMIGCDNIDVHKSGDRLAVNSKKMAQF